MLGLLLAVRVAHVEIGMKTGGMGRAIGFFGSQGVMAGFAGYIVVLLKDYWGFG